MHKIAWSRSWAMGATTFFWSNLWLKGGLLCDWFINLFDLSEYDITTVLKCVLWVGVMLGNGDGSY